MKVLNSGAELLKQKTRSHCWMTTTQLLIHKQLIVSDSQEDISMIFGQYLWQVYRTLLVPWANRCLLRLRLSKRSWFELDTLHNVKLSYVHDKHVMKIWICSLLTFGVTGTDMTFCVLDESPVFVWPVQPTQPTLWLWPFSCILQPFLETAQLSWLGAPVQLQKIWMCCGGCWLKYCSECFVLVLLILSAPAPICNRPILADNICWPIHLSVFILNILNTL